MTEKGCWYETLKGLRSLARMGNFFCSVDLKDGYFAIAIHPDHQKFFTFDLGKLHGDPKEEEGRYITMVTLSFGWSNSGSFIFTKVMRVLVSALRSPGVRP